MTYEELMEVIAKVIARLAGAIAKTGRTILKLSILAIFTGGWILLCKGLANFVLSPSPSWLVPYDTRIQLAGIVVGVVITLIYAILVYNLICYDRFFER